MAGKRVSALLFLLIIVSFPLAMWAQGGFAGLTAPKWGELRSGAFAARVEQTFQERFPAREELSNFAWNLRYRTGAKEIDGYYVTGSSIIKNVGSPSSQLVERNNEILLAFAERARLPSYLLLTPTASAVKQQLLPDFATPYNQKAFIEQVYQKFGGQMVTVDVYPTLFANRDKELYYNTEDALTSLGGYYIYSVLADKLGMTAYSLDRFTIEYALHGYKGALQQKFPYAPAESDVITLFHYRLDKFYRTYEVTRTQDGENEKLGDLYARDRLTGPRPLDVYFGGMAQVIDIQVRNEAGKPLPNQVRLLIIGDDTARSYVPFLAPQYSEIKIVDATTATPEQIEDVDLLYYDQVLFAFSTDTYMHCENLEVLRGL
ncbi:hypothetical protein H8711_12900 [Clostridiaceae bacterium NSJ-31]|uniref:DHHW protein n=1 Tax=Ligaoa zhengdingensis TaxID=2763658 RepID=A0A926DYX4_9FIRM|nr:hypothetical protein [Ligaoa zhengdingensis]